MNIENASVVVTGGASGLGLATAKRLGKAGASVVIVDLPTSRGEEVAAEIGAQFAAADVTDEVAVNAALDVAESGGKPIRAVVHCAGSGHTLRVLDKEGNPAPLEHFVKVINTNLIGSFNVLRLASARMARNESLDGERGVIVLTASVAAYEGQIGQIPYASSKAGVIGMTIVAARDLAGKEIRVATIAPGIFETPLLGRLSEEVRASLGKSVPHPKRLGTPDEYAMLASHIVENPMINGETIRLDGAIRMAPR
ncbi:NAD(P)-dependent dehydrogenase (short-subunit alcohol dehydrogenase family) [Rhodococcus erythropolis]|uniref:SDR family NAD(P)-dependent oxidoreductase n=1 Tax=Rhodococcus erythropolis TaxID=1833 RepID=UPI002167EDFB|nr:SDR family NAD(P)-dependent oxidoreductase [Rhodococcus erythropolis]MCS4255999.1 NAD(P)-dependent dehydrogenase (short-subunit alcohol dehydrogenase family) [Rhodococcus erythropolis]MCW2425515.1 NAD(P)-dependent dehydrogenase (short-subunit alcohol dehydrogenase family) [Rhodococcus erythropolis]